MSVAPAAGAACADGGGHLNARFRGLHPESSEFTRPFDAVAEPALAGSTTTEAFEVYISGHPCGEWVRFRYQAGPGTASTSDFTPFDKPVQRYMAADENAAIADGVEVKGDDETESVVESVLLSFSNPDNIAFSFSPVPMFIVDTDGDTDRVAFDGAPTTVSESDLSGTKIPVFRAGPATSSATVSYSVTPGPGTGATPGTDFTGPTGTLTFGPDQRVASIPISVTNDSEPEPDEAVTVTLTGADTATVAGPSSTTLTIRDNEESSAPQSRFHHPRNGLRYQRGDYRLREMHIFTSDEGGSGVARAELALRKNLKSGSCSWWTGKGWTSGACGARHWLNLPTYEPDFFYYRIGALRPSVRSAIKDYTAFARAIDHAGNVESKFEQGRNESTFEIRAKKKRKRS